MEKIVFLLLLCLAAASASVKVVSRSSDERHPAKMDLEVQLPDSVKKVRIPLTRNDKFENVPMTVSTRGVKRTFSAHQVHHPSHAHYSDVETKSIVSVREIDGKKQFSGHFMHNGVSYFIEPSGGGHTVTRNPVTPEQLLRNLEKQRRDAKNTVSRKRRQLGTSDTTYVIEIGLCVDYKSYQKIQEIFPTNTLSEVHVYYTHIMTGVDVAYRNIGDPSISIEVVSMHIDTTDSDYNCMPAPDVTDRLQGDVILNFLKDKKAAMSNPPDHYMSFTGEDILSGTSNSVCGKAFVSGTCTNIGVSINEDQGLQSWGTAAHELAHNMGSPHDGDSNACDPNNQQLMSPVGGIYDLATVANSYTFSSCSIEKMKQYIDSLSDGGCLKTSMGVQMPSLSNAEPIGTRLSLDQSCELSYGTNPGKFFLSGEAETNPAVICAKIFCATSNGGGTTTSGLRAPPGESCGNKKACNWNGQCIEDANAPEADESCFWGDLYSQGNCEQWVNVVKYDQYASYCSFVKSKCCKMLKDPAYNSGVVCS